jgi:LPS export ABC transporter protein LptC
MAKWIRLSLTAGAILLGLVVSLNSFGWLPGPTSAQRPIISGPITMTSPKYSGFSGDGRHRYEVAAKSAVQVPNGDHVNLNEPSVTLELANGRKLALQAPTGVFNVSAAVLTMRNDVVGTSGTGDALYLSQAVVDLNNNTLVSDGPVEVKSEQTILRGNHLELLGSGFIVISNGSINRDDNVVYFHTYALP